MNIIKNFNANTNKYKAQNFGMAFRKPEEEVLVKLENAINKYYTPYEVMDFRVALKQFKEEQDSNKVIDTILEAGRSRNKFKLKLVNITAGNKRIDNIELDFKAGLNWIKTMLNESSYIATRASLSNVGDIWA